MTSIAVCVYKRRRCHVTSMTSSAILSWTTTKTTIGRTVNQTTPPAAPAAAAAVAMVDRRHHALTAYLTLTFTASRGSLGPPRPDPPQRRHYDGIHTLVACCIRSSRSSHERSYSTLSPVSTGMGDRLRAGVPPRYVTRPRQLSITSFRGR